MSVKVLVIEDNPGNLYLIEYLLDEFGYKPICAQDGQEGVEAALEHKPDLILCDIHMPKMDGFEVLRRLKTDPDLGSTPIVAVTALAMVGDNERILRAGFDGYLPKPIDPEKFVQQITGFVESRSS
ncbi:MAG: response regulator [Acidobacteriaceae bacterium]|nr:response regulator [Acidobacteriaceae bacterium]MBV9779090.1 response regulator [Acidobacteriaceae bacterium]